jgi:glycosyltransferase involved in cell wall biosynthesis
MKLACTGFVSATTGSVTAANALLIKELLARGLEIDFFSKPTFVDPRPAVGDLAGFRFVPVINRAFDSLRQKLERIALIGAAAGVVDAYSYNRLLVREIGREHQQRQYDLCLWLGDYARGAVPGLATISFPQGPPGTDARSILARAAEIRRLVGPAKALKWQLLARLRVSRLGTPPLHCSGHFIIGSRQSSRTLQTIYHVDPQQISMLPYPIDLELFKPPSDGLGATDSRPSTPLRALWLGRIVPRKRLDVFLEGASQAISQGLNVSLTLVGSSGFIPGYESMISTFPFPDRLEHRPSVDRNEVPAVLHEHDVLAQPSDEENFGSSVAEAQACGLPVIVGHTNGNADYLSTRDIQLADERPETFANALFEMSRRKNSGNWGETTISRRVAEENFRVGRVTDELVRILEKVHQRCVKRSEPIGRDI